jgi:hypothetical protein
VTGAVQRLPSLKFGLKKLNITLLFTTFVFCELGAACCAFLVLIWALQVIIICRSFFIWTF